MRRVASLTIGDALDVRAIHVDAENARVDRPARVLT
jgi:hypothetical protein